MNDLTQLLTDPTLCAKVQSFDLTKLAGLTTFPVVEQLVQYFREQWALPTRLAPLVAAGLGVAFNMGLALYMGLSLGDAAALGGLTGVLAAGWHEIKK